MKSIPEHSVSVRVSVSRIKPFRLAEGVFEVHWWDRRRHRRILVAPVDPARPTLDEVLDAVRSAYPEGHRPAVVIADRAWP